MSEIFSALLTADLVRSVTDIHIPDHQGTLIYDIQTQLALPDVVWRPEFLFDPQIIIADNANEAQENAEFLIERQCLESQGWTNHLAIIKDISEVLAKYLAKIPLSGDHALGFYIISGTGLKHDATGQLVQYGVSGAFPGIDEYDAYTHFKETHQNGAFFQKPGWVGGLARIIQIPEEKLLQWKHSWVPGHVLQQFQRTPGTMVH